MASAQLLVDGGDALENKALLEIPALNPPPVTAGGDVGNKEKANGSLRTTGHHDDDAEDDDVDDGGRHTAAAAAADDDDDIEAFDEELVVPDGGWGWMVCFGSFVVNFILDGTLFCFGILMLELLEDFGEEKSTTSWIGSVQMGIHMITGPVISVLLLRFSIRQVTITGSLIAAGAYVVSVFAPNVYVLILTYGVIAGIGIGMAFLPGLIVVGLYFNKKRAIATGIATSGSGVGTFGYACIMDLLLSNFNWRGTVLILGGLMLNCAVCGMLFRPLVPRKRATKPTPDNLPPDGQERLSNHCNGDATPLVKSDSISIHHHNNNNHNVKRRFINGDVLHHRDAAETAAEDAAAVGRDNTDDNTHNFCNNKERGCSSGGACGSDNCGHKDDSVSPQCVSHSDVVTTQSKQFGRDRSDSIHDDPRTCRQNSLLGDLGSTSHHDRDSGARTTAIPTGVPAVVITSPASDGDIRREDSNHEDNDAALPTSSTPFSTQNQGERLGENRAGEGDAAIHLRTSRDTETSGDPLSLNWTNPPPSHGDQDPNIKKITTYEPHLRTTSAQHHQDHDRPDNSNNDDSNHSSHNCKQPLHNTKSSIVTPNVVEDSNLDSSKPTLKTVPPYHKSLKQRLVNPQLRVVKDMTQPNPRNKHLLGRLYKSAEHLNHVFHRAAVGSGSGQGRELSPLVKDRHVTSEYKLNDLCGSREACLLAYVHRVGDSGLSSRETLHAKEVIQEQINKGLLNPMLRKDIFYSGSVSHLPAYQNLGSVASFVVAMTRENGNLEVEGKKEEVEEEEKRGVWKCCNLVTKCFPRELMTDRIFLLLLVTFTMWTAQSVSMTYLPDLAVTSGINRSDAAFLISVVGIANVLGRLVAGFVTDCFRIPSIWLYFAALCLASVINFMFPHCQSYLLLTACAAIFGLCMAVAVSMRTIVLAEQLGIEALTQSFGVVALFQGVMFVITPPIAGKLLDGFGSYYPPFVLAAFMYAVSASSTLAVGCLNMSRTRRMCKEQEIKIGTEILTDVEKV